MTDFFWDDFLKNRTIIFGIETSCDETAAAVVADGCDVLSSVISSQIDLHKIFGGVVPEIAARSHIEKILTVLSGALEAASVGPADLSAIAVANCPGLTPSLLIGVTAAKSLAFSWQKPLISVNHVHCHLQSALLERKDDPFPAVALVVSGGHTSLYRCGSILDLELLGRTLDDAAGEAFDKVAMILKLPYPGGPSIEKAAASGDASAIRFPRTYLSKGSLDFSFSGIKTAVLYHCRGQDMLGRNRVDDMSERQKSDIAASFQAAVVDVLVNKALLAAESCSARTVLIGGGVAANSLLRSRLAERCDVMGLHLIIAEKRYCTDNAAMVGGLGYHKYLCGDFADLSLEPCASGA